MDDECDGTTEPVEKRTAVAARAGISIYRQVAAVLGAFSLLALLRHAVDIEWRGVLAEVLGFWDAVVRPATKWLTNLALDRPLSWALGTHIEIPLFVRDYLAAGAMMMLSMWRTTAMQMLHGPGFFAKGNGWPKLRMAMVSLLVIAGWPSLLLIAAGLLIVKPIEKSGSPVERFQSNAEAEVPDFQSVRRSALLSLTPLAYCALLVAINPLLR